MLMESVIALSILSLVLILVFTFQQDVFSLERLLSLSLTAQEEARQTFKVLTAEIRSASPSSLGTYPLERTEDNVLIFYTDVNDDGMKERVRYFLEGTDFKKGILVPSGNPLTYDPTQERLLTLAHDVATSLGPIFTYYGVSYDGTTAPLSSPVRIADVRLVKVSLTIDRDPTRPPGPLTHTTQVTIRNVKEPL